MCPELLVKTSSTGDENGACFTRWYHFVGYDVTWRQMRRSFFTCHLISATLDFTNFLKSQEITEINTKWSLNAYEMYKFLNFCNLTRNTVKITGLCPKIIFGQTYKQFVDAMATSSIKKWWTHIKISSEDKWTATESFSPLKQPSSPLVSLRGSNEFSLSFIL